ncbi:MAG TPA: serpin family protein [Terracidiphilus sp.]|nr:serpin family protein [Terracidiphilus sp.]
MKSLLLVLVPLMFLQEAAMTQTAPPVPTPGQAELVKGNNAFAVDLYGRLRQQDGNLFFSPASISTAFAMAYAGASGSTAAEMAATLHFTLPPNRLHAAMGALLGDMNAEHTGYQLHVADALWAQKDESFLLDFLKLTKADYGAGFRPVDFKHAPEAVRVTINQWVAEQTADKIKDLLAPGVLTPATRLVLTNAIYFKGDWQSQFDKAQTRDEDFHLSAAQTVKAPLMHLQGRFSYFSGGTFQALEIPYKSGELSMIALLPNEAGGLPALEQSLTAANEQQWLSQLGPAQKVILTLPSFKMTEKFELNDALAALGMRQAFEKGVADFSAMTGKRDFWISTAVHKAFIDVNEEGTEAAAATGIVMRSMAMAREQPPIVFRADHPFLFLIRDNRSGGILFMGRVADPAK